MNPLYKLIGWFISLTTPLLLLMTAINLLITPLFADIEYNLPNFPQDTYGFSKQERIQWSNYAIQYLRNKEDIHYLGDLTFDNGKPLFNTRELKHMEDVKILVNQMITAWYLGIAIMVVFAFWSHRAKWQGFYWYGLYRGGQITIGLIVAVLIAVLTSFSALFTAFHRIFFQGDTWLFKFSDTLIRLFPLRFWQDAFILMGTMTVLGAVVLIIIGRKRSTR